MNRSPVRSAERCSRRHVSRNHLRQERNRFRSRRLFLERLEDRALLATMVWDGGGTNANWTTAANWVGDVAPNQDDNLIFPSSGAVQTTNTNDFAAGTRFRSITISSAAYNISGNNVTLLEGFVYNAAASGAQFTAPITLGAAQTFYSANSGASVSLGAVNAANLQQLTFDGRGDMTVGGVLSGTGSIVKAGDGAINLAADNSAYQGLITVNQGKVIASHGNALGATTAGTIVNLGGQVQVAGGAAGITIGEPIVLNGFGPGFDGANMGALYNLGGVNTGANTWTGTVTLGSTTANEGNTGIGAAAGSSLNITGAVSSLPGATLNAGDNGLVKFGEGNLGLGGSTDNLINSTVTVLQGTLTLSKTGTAHPFYGNLTIGDNRDALSNPAKVVLGAGGQIPEVNYFGTGVNTVTVNSNGTLDLAGKSDMIGNLTLLTGRSSGAVVQSGSGTLTLLGDVTVNNFQGSSGALNASNLDTGLASAALIKGKLDLGSFFSGAGGVATRTISVADTALFNMNPDLIISADISGGSTVSLSKTGAGTLLLSGNNSYFGATRLTAGETDIASDTAFGNSSILAIGSGSATFLRSTDATGLAPADHSVSSSIPLSLDGTVQIFGTGDITFGGRATLTAARTITNYDPGQVTTFAGGIDENFFSGLGLTKTGRGEINISGPASFTGGLTIGANTGLQDGGTVRFSGDSGALVKNFTAIAIGVNSSLILDNSASNLTTGNTDGRLPDATAISLNGGTLRLIANGTAGTTEIVGVVTPIAAFTSTIESDTTGAGSARLNMWGLAPPTNTATLNFVGGGTALSGDASAQNQINVLQSASGAAGLIIQNNVIANAVIINPDNSLDFATLVFGTNGQAIAPLPPEGYVTSFAASNPTSNVKITSGSVTLDQSRTVNALLLGPGVTLSGGDTTSTLTLANGPLLLNTGSNLAVPFTQFSAAAPSYIVAGGASGNTSTISGILAGTASTNTTKGGAGTLVLNGANQFTAPLLINQGIVNVSNNAGLGSAGGATTVNLGGQLQLTGGLTILGEGLTAIGMGPGTGTYGVGMSNTDGALYITSGTSLWTGTVALGLVTTLDGPALFPNGGSTSFTGSSVNVAPGASHTFSGVLSTAANLVKLGGGQLELAGISANTISLAPVIKQGTLLLNKAPGIAALAPSALTLLIGDDVSGNSASLKFAADNQIANTNNNVQVASNGTLDLNGNDQVLTNLILEAGTLGGATVNVGSSGNLGMLGQITVASLGGNNTTGAAISGGTMGLNVFNNATAATRTILVNDAATGSDLTLSSAIVDGTGFAAMAVTKSGFGTLQYDGSVSNTYTGTTTVQDGTLNLNKSPGVSPNTLALSGPLSIGNNDIASGFAESDVVKLLAGNQLPDYNAAVTVTSTGLLDLNGFSDAIGSADGIVALTVNAGTVKSGAGTLTVNGDITTTTSIDLTGLSNNPDISRAPIISGNLNIGDNFARSLSVTGPAAAQPSIQVHAIISANITGKAELLRTAGVGAVLFSGDNTNFTGNVFLTIASNVTYLGASPNPLGTGTIYYPSTVSFFADGGPVTLTNNFLGAGFTFGGGNNLKISGKFDLNAATTLAVPNAAELELAGGVGEILAAGAAGVVLTKTGSGFLTLSAPALYSGATNITASGTGVAGGEIRLIGTGRLTNTASIAVGLGSTLSLDNMATADANRVRDAANITLNGGTLELIGNSSIAVNEILGGSTGLTTAANITSFINTNSQGASVKLSVNTLSKGTNSFLLFNGQSASTDNDLGSANNQVIFYTPPTTLLLNGILPFAAIRTLDGAGNSDLEFAGYNALVGVSPVTTLTSLAGATAKDNVKITADTVVSTPTSVNALLIVGNSKTISGASAITVASGTVLNVGGSNTISAPINFGGSVGLLETPNVVQNLTLSGVVDGQSGLAKFGFGALNLGNANTYAGTTTIFEGTTRISNPTALGVSSLGQTTHGTTVNQGAALELSGGISVLDEALTIQGLGFGYGNQGVISSGNTGALRSMDGGNTWTGNITLTPGLGNAAVVGVDTGVGSSLILSGILSSTGLLTKVGGGQLDLTGTAANTYSGGTAILDGTLRLGKTAGLAAIPGTVLTLGDNIGGANADQLVLLASDQIADANAITVAASGKLDLSNQNETVTAVVTVTSGLASNASVTTGSGTFTIASNSMLTYSPQASTLGNANAVIVDGILALQVNLGAGPNTRTINVNDSIADVDLKITAKITDGDNNASVENLTVQNGTNNIAGGRLELAPAVASDFSGVFTVTSQGTGIVRARVSTAGALGAAGAGAGTVVTTPANNTGNSLEIIGGITIAGELLTISGTGTAAQSNTGFGGAGALRSLSGANVWTGNVTLGAAAFANTIVIGVDSGSLNLSGAIGQFAGANFTVSKLLPGTLIYSGSSANTYAGGTNIQEGSLRLAKDTNVDALAAGTVTVSNDLGNQDDDGLFSDNSNQINDAATVVIATAGMWNLGGNTETLTGAGTVLTFNVGLANRPHVKNGTIVLGGNTVDQSNIVTGAGSGAGNMLITTPGAVVDSDVTLNMSGVRRTFNLAGAIGATQNALQFDGLIVNGQLHKATSAGTLVLTNASNNMGSISEVQSLLFTGTITVGSTFSLTHNGNTFAGIQYDTNATNLIANVQAATDALFGATNTLVSGTATQINITFQNGLANVNLQQSTVVSALVGGSVFAITSTEGGGNEIQTVAIGTANGTFTLSSSGVAGSGATQLTFTTGTSPTLAQVKAHLDTIPALLGNYTVIGAAGGLFTIVYNNTLSTVNVPALTATSTGGTGAPTITTLFEANGANETQTLTNSGAASGSFTLTFRGGTTPALAFNAAASTIQSALENLSTIGSSNVSVAGPAGGPYTILFTGALASRDVPDVTVANSGPTFAIAAPTGSIGGAILLQSGGLAVSNSGALGGGLSAARGTADGSLRAFGGSVTIARPIDVNANTPSRVFTVYGDQAINFAGPVTVNNVATTIQNSVTAPVAVTFSGTGANSLDLGVQTLTMGVLTNATTTISGNIVDTAGATAAGALIKTGAGVLVLSGTNTYRGTTTVSAGILRASSDNALGAATTSVTQRLTITAAAGTVRLSYGGQLTQDISLAVSDAVLMADIQEKLSRLSTVNLSTATSPQTTGIVTVTNPSAGNFDIAFSGSLAGSSTTIPAPTFAGGGAGSIATQVTGGVGPTSIATTAALEVLAGVNLSGEAFTSLAGVGFNGVPTGALRLIENTASDETSTLSGNITLVTPSPVISVAAANDQLTLTGVITGAFTVIKYGAGTLELGGTAPNTHGIAASSLTVNEGTVRLNKPTGVSASGTTGPVIVGDNLGAAGSDKLVYVGVEQTPDALAYTINSTGQVSTTAGTAVGDIQTVAVQNTTTAGTFTITVPTFGTSTAIAFNAAGNPTEPGYAGAGTSVQEILEAIPGIGSGKVTVATAQYTSAAAGQFGRIYRITFDASLGDIQVLTANGSSLSPVQASMSVAYIAQFRQETIGTPTLVAASGKAANVALASGTRLATGNTPVISQLATLNRDPKSITISGGTLAMAGPTVTTGGSYTLTVPAFTTDMTSAVPELLIDSAMVDGTAVATTQTIVKAGAGMLALTQPNTYSGATTINAGTFVLSGSGSATSTSTVAVAGGATLILDNTGTNVANRLRDAAPISLGTSGGAGGTLIFKGNSLVASTEQLGALTLVANSPNIIRSQFGFAGQTLTFAASSGAIVSRGAGATLNLVTDSDFILGTNEVRFVNTGSASLPAMTGGIFPWATVTTFAGQATEALDLVRDLDPAATIQSLGRVAVYNASNVKATGPITLGSTINALLVSGNGVTVTVPAGGTSVTSGQIVGYNGSTANNTISGGKLNFGSAEPLFFAQGADSIQQLSLNGASAGQISLTFTLNAAPAPVTGTTQVTPSTLQTTAVLDVATLSVATLQSALEGLPTIGVGNVLVTLASGVFTITFMGLLAGGAMPQLIVNNFGTTGGNPSVITLAGGGTLSINSGMTGLTNSRKERKGTLRLGGENPLFNGNIIVNEGELIAAAANSLGNTTGTTTVNSGAQLTYSAPSDIVFAAETITLNGAGYLNNNTGALRSAGAGSATSFAAITIGSSNTVIGTPDTAGDLVLAGVINFGAATGLNTIKVGGGTLELSGNAANTATATDNLYVNQGTLRLNKFGGAAAAIPTNLTLTVGDNDGGPNADLVTYGSLAQNDQMGTGAITINRSGQFDYSAYSDTVGNVAIVDGNITGTTGFLTIGTLTMTGGMVNPVLASPGSEIQQLSLAGAGGNFRLSYGGVNSTDDLTFTAGLSPTAFDVQTQLDTIPALAGNTLVAGADGGPFTISYVNDLADTNINEPGSNGGLNLSVATGTVTPTWTTTAGSGGTLILGGAVSVNASNTGSQAVINGTISLAAASRNFTVADAPVRDDLVINANIASATAAGVTAASNFNKLGAGVAVLNGTNFVTGTNETQTITFSSGAALTTGGTFTLAFAGQQTGPITFTAGAPATIQAAILAALQGLSTIGTGNVTVSTPGTDLGPYTVTFVNALAGTDVPAISAPVTLTLTTTSGTTQPSIAFGGAAGVTAYSLGVSAAGGILALGSPNALGVAGNRTGLNLTAGELWAYGADRTIDNSLQLTAVTLGARRDSSAPYSGPGDAIFEGTSDPYDITFSSSMRGMLVAAATLTVQEPNSVATISGNLGESAAINAAGITFSKAGIGTLFMGGDNRYVGATTVSAGKLDITSNNALGATRNAVQQLQVQTSPAIAAGTFGLSFTAPVAFGAITSITSGAAGSTTEAGNTVTFTTSGAHGFSAGQVVSITGMTPATYNGTWVITSVPSSTTFTYVNPATAIAASSGTAGNVALAPSTPFTYTSGVTATQIQNDLNALSSIGGIGASVQVTQINPSGSLSNPQLTTFLIEFQGSLAGQDVGAITVVNGPLADIPIGGATEPSGNTVIVNTTGPHFLTTGQTVTIAGVGAGYNGQFAVTVNSPTQFTYTSASSGLAASTTQGTVSLVSSTTITAPTTIVRGNGAAATLAGETTVAAGAALIVDGSLTIGNRGLTLTSGVFQGSGYLGDIEPFLKGHGSIIQTGGQSTWGAGETPMALSGTAFTVSIGATSGSDSLTLNGNIAQAAANTGISKVGAGTLVLAGNAPNSFGGSQSVAAAQVASFVNDGTLVFNKTPGMPALLGTLFVGDNFGTGTDILELRQSEQADYGGGSGAALFMSPVIAASGKIQTNYSTSTTNEVQTLVSTAAGNFTLNAGGPIATAVAGINSLSTPFQLQSILNAPGVLVPGVTARVLQFGATATFTNVIIFNSTTPINYSPITVTGGGMSVGTVTHGGQTNRQTVNLLTEQIGYDTTNPTTGKSSTIDLTTGSGTLYMAAATNTGLTVNVMPGAVGTSSASILGGTIGLLQDTATALALRQFTVADSSLATDLSITSRLIDGAFNTETQTIIILGTATPGNFTLSGGPLTTTTGNIPTNATAIQVQTAIAAVLPSTVDVVVTLAGTTYTVKFTGLTSNPGTMTVASNTDTGVTIATNTTIDFVVGFTGGLTKQIVANFPNSRMVLNNASSFYSGNVSITGALQVSNAADLGGSTSAGTVTVATASALEIAGSITIPGTAKTLAVSGTGLANTDEISATATGIGTRVNSAAVAVNSGAVRVLNGNTVSWSPNVTISTDSVLSIEGNSTATLGSNLTGAGLFALGTNNIVKAGTGTLTLTGTTASTGVAPIFINQGTLVLNRLGANAGLLGTTVFVGDGLGSNDTLQYGSMGGTAQLPAAANVTVLSSGKIDQSTASNFSNEIQMLTFPSGAVNTDQFTLSLLGFTTPTITYTGASATTITAINNALNTVFPIGAIVASAVGTSNFDFQLAFTGPFANTNLPAFTVANVTGARPPYAQVVRAGVGATVQSLNLSTGASGGTVTPQFNVPNITTTTQTYSAAANEIQTLSLPTGTASVGSSRVDLQACKLEYSIVSPK